MKNKYSFLLLSLLICCGCSSSAKPPKCTESENVGSTNPKTSQLIDRNFHYTQWELGTNPTLQAKIFKLYTDMLCAKARFGGNFKAIAELSHLKVNCLPDVLMAEERIEK